MGNPNFANPAKTAQDRENARNDVLEHMLLWYLQESLPGVVPELAVDKKAFNGEILYWYEPIIPGVTNPVLVEIYKGGENWSLEMKPMQKKITNLRPG